jgi:hypothetical protein
VTNPINSSNSRNPIDASNPINPSNSNNPINQCNFLDNLIKKIKVFNIKDLLQ